MLHPISILHSGVVRTSCQDSDPPCLPYKGFSSDQDLPGHFRLRLSLKVSIIDRRQSLRLLIPRETLEMRVIRVSHSQGDPGNEGNKGLSNSIKSQHIRCPPANSNLILTALIRVGPVTSKALRFRHKLIPGNGIDS